MLEETLTLTRDLGKNAPELIANLVVNGTIPAIEELVANAYDADATRVDIDLDFSQNQLVIRDNGTGMGRDGLQSFYRLGDSPKVSTPVSTNGRTRIGKFGVATILLKSLCTEYYLHTTDGDIDATVSENLEGRVQAEKPIDARIARSESGETGTELTLKGLKFKEGDGHFTTDNLRKKIQWDLPLLPDFEVYINGEQVKGKAIEKSTTFRIDTFGEYAGDIQGNIHLTNSPTEHAGMYIYVNGRSVGDPKQLLSQVFTKRGVLSRIIGTVNANDLEDAILFDRGRFREDHPGFLELESLLKRAGNQVANFYARNNEKKAQAKVSGRKETLLKNAVEQIHRIGISEIETVSTKGAFFQADERELGRYDSTTNTIHLNESHPMLRIGSNQSSQKYEQALLTASLDVLALYMSQAQSGRIHEFLNARSTLWESANPLTISTRDRDNEELHPMIMYTLSEIAQVRGRNIGSLRAAAQHGMLEVEDGRIQGEAYQRFEDDTKGLVSLYDVVHAHKDTAAIAITLERLHNVLEKAGSAMNPFVYDLSRNGSPCYFVEGTCSEPVWDIFSDKRTDLRVKDVNPGAVFREYGEQYLTMPQLPQYANGIDRKTVADVITYSKGSGTPIRVDREGGSAKFHFADFVRNMQKMRDVPYAT